MVTYYIVMKLYYFDLVRIILKNHPNRCIIAYVDTVRLISRKVPHIFYDKASTNIENEE